MQDNTSWKPVNVVINPVAANVDWAMLDIAGLNNPFFDRGVDAYLKNNPGCARKTTGLNQLINFSDKEDCIRPAGFIFHVSRCGSTLLSSLIQSLSGNVVIAEAQPISAVLSPYSKMWPLKRKEWSAIRQPLLRGTINALLPGCTEKREETRYFIKFTSWNTIMLDLVLDTWPQVPWAFIYRNPAEVIASCLNSAPAWLRNVHCPAGVASILNVGLRDFNRMRVEEYYARLLSHYLDRAANRVCSNAMILDYENLTPENISLILGFFGITSSPEDVTHIKETMKYYSKSPGNKISFERDSIKKQQQAHGLVNELVSEWVGAGYDRIKRHSYDFDQEKPGVHSQVT